MPVEQRDTHTVVYFSCDRDVAGVTKVNQLAEKQIRSCLVERSPSRRRTAVWGIHRAEALHHSGRNERTLIDKHVR
jgi:hypothetical protein